MLATIPNTDIEWKKVLSQKSWLVYHLTRVRMRIDFRYRLIEKYFKQLIDSVRVLWPHAVVLRRTILHIIVLRHAPAHAKAHMRCTAAIDESVHQIWRNRFVNSWKLTQSQFVSLRESSWEFSMFCMFWPHNFAKQFQKFHIWNKRLFQMPFERVKSASAQPNARVLA